MTRADVRWQLRQVLTALSVAVLSAACLFGCDSETGLPSGDFGGFGNRRTCIGAFTPHSEACWDANDGGDEGEVSANGALSQEVLDQLPPNCSMGLQGAPGTPGKLTVTFTTKVTGGLYSPRNCGAVWIEDPFRFYIRTLELWTAERHMSIVQWNASVCKTDMTYQKPDVTTSATLPGPKMHTSTWDMKDYRGNVVADGDYVLWMQVAENEIFPEGPFIQIPFTKGPEPKTITMTAETMASELDGFKDITVTYTPTPK
jgi:hypothetical protein